jgi:hypothetical protein
MSKDPGRFKKQLLTQQAGKKEIKTNIFRRVIEMIREGRWWGWARP